MKRDKKEKTEAAPSDGAPIEALRTEDNERLVLLRKQPNGKYGMVAALGAGENDLLVIQQKWGGGEYWARLQAQSGNGWEWVSGRPGRPVSALFTIEGPPKVEAAPSSADPGLAMVVAELRALREKDPAPRLDMVTLLTALPAALASFAQLLKALAPANAAAPALSPAELIRALREMHELSEDLAPERPPALPQTDNLMLGVFDRISAMAEKAIDAQKGNGTAVKRLPAPSPAPSTPPGAAPVSIEQLVSTYLPQLLKLAEQGRAADVYAVVLLDQLDDVTVARLEEHFKTEENRTALKRKLFEFSAAAAAKKEWFDEFFDALAAELGEDGQPEEEPQVSP